MSHSQALSDKQFAVIADFRYQLRKFVRFSEERARAAGITPLQYLLLLQIRGIDAPEGVTISELAERLQAKHHGVVALVDRSVRAELVTRRPCVQDARQVRVQLTDKGGAILEHLARQHLDQLLALNGRFAVPGRTELQQ